MYSASVPGYWRTSGSDDTHGERRERRTGPDRPRHEPAEEIHLELAREASARIDAEVDLRELAGLPDFGDVLPDLDRAVISWDAIGEPWMDPDDPDGERTAAAWRQLGYAVEVPAYRRRYARNLAYLLRCRLTHAKLEHRERTADGMLYQVRTGLIGENGRHAVLVTRWLVRGTDPERPGPPELLAAWPEPLPALPPGDSETSPESNPDRRSSA